MVMWIIMAVTSDSYFSAHTPALWWKNSLTNQKRTFRLNWVIFLVSWKYILSLRKPCSHDSVFVPSISRNCGSDGDTCSSGWYSSAGISLPLSFESLLCFLAFIFSTTTSTLLTTFSRFTAKVFAGVGLLSHGQVLLVSLHAASEVGWLREILQFFVHSIHSDMPSARDLQALLVFSQHPARGLLRR